MSHNKSFVCIRAKANLGSATVAARDMSQIANYQRQLTDLIRSLGKCVVALSGGVDSAVVCRAAYDALGPDALAVTAVSPSLATGELDAARQVARTIGIAHRIVETGELNRADYRKNGPDRCFHCKTELYEHLHALAATREGSTVILNGANADDLSDHRPGMRAAIDHQVRSPLAECGIGKQVVRELAAAWQLPVWDKPAMPCLASRIAYGVEVTPARLAMIDRGEQLLRALGLDTVRVRYHDGDLARLEVSADQIQRLCEPQLRQTLMERFEQIGFRFVTVDLAGFRSGSMNTLLPIEVLEQHATNAGEK